MSPTTLVSPGNVVVPLSEIIDRLQGKLSSADIEQLLYAIISRKKTEVRPGDLITADLFNQVLADIEDLNARVAALAGGGSAGSKHSLAIAAFHDAWKAYGGLAKNGAFLPTSTTAEAMASALTISAHLQDVMYTALAGGSLSYLGGTNTLLEAFTRLYDRQHDLVVLFSAPIAGISDTSEHKRFATLLNLILEQDALGAPSLKKSLTTSDLDGAIAAQNRINGMVRDQGGDVITGNIEVTYKGAVGTTETLVIGSTTPVLYAFSVTNKTNRNLDVQLKGEFLAPREAWTAQTSVVGVDGVARSHIPLAPFNPLNPADPSATQEIRIAAMTPTGATDGQTGVLQLTAFVPHPINRSGSASRELTVRNAAIPQTPGIVTYAVGSPVPSGDLAHAKVGTTLSLEFKFSFSKGTGPATREFRFRLDIETPTNPDQFFSILFGPADAAIDSTVSTAVKKVSKSFPMNDGNVRTVTAFIRPLAGSSTKTLKFKATVESATDGVKAESPSFTVSVD